MLKTGIEIIDGVSILTEKLLVLFKMKAWLDLKERKTKGESIDSDNIKKHKNDVFRLSQLILDTTPISLPKDVKTDVKNFCSQMLEEDVDLKSLNIKTTKEKILQKYKSLYNIE